MKSRFLQILFVAVLGVSGIAYWLLSSSVVKPHLSGDMQTHELEVDGHLRSYQVYTPKQLQDHTLLIVLHGSMGSAEKVRQQSQFSFESLADKEGFLLVYPDGYEGHWNDCRRTASYSARRLDINDSKFLRLMAQQILGPGSLKQKIFVVGFSNGGHMAFKLAMEESDWVDGIAAISANLPVAENNACEFSGLSISALVMNGKHDPINPYDGGQVALFGFGDRGQVLSSRETLAVLAQRNYRQSAKQHAVSNSVERHIVGSAEIERWYRESARFELVSLNDGGHTIPVFEGRMPRLLGNTNHDINAAEIIWSFFSRLN